MKNAPGPWAVENADTNMILIRAADGYEVALIPTGSLASNYRPDQDPENAKLIAAAPEMLEALKMVLKDESVTSFVWEAANRAVDKAGGRNHG